MKPCHVHLQSNGDYWLARWADDNGKPRGKSLGLKSGMSRRAAADACRVLADEHARQPSGRNTRRGQTLGEWIAAFAELTPTYSAGTRALYGQTAALLRDYFGAGRRMDKIDRHAAAQWRAKLGGRTFARDAKGENRHTITESTVRKHVRNAKVIFGLAVRHDKIAFNPFDREAASPPAVDKSWAYISLADLDKLMVATPGQPWRSLLALCRLAGLRLGEALRLTWGDVDQASRLLTVVHEGEATTKKRRREVPMVPALQSEMLTALEKTADGEARVCPISESNLRRIMLGTIKRAGIDPWGKPFHTLRKNCESDWLAEHPVMAVCDWLGHNPAVAAKHYYRASADVIGKVTGKSATGNEVATIKNQIAELKTKLDKSQNVKT